MRVKLRTKCLAKLPIVDLPVDFYERSDSEIPGVRANSRVRLSNNQDYPLGQVEQIATYNSTPVEMVGVEAAQRLLYRQAEDMRERLQGRSPAGIVAVVDSIPVDLELTGNTLRVTPGYTRVNIEFRLYAKKWP